MKTILRVNELRTYFYVLDGVIRAVDGISLELNEREIIGLIGESGCGKTMTVLSILRLIPESGKIVGGNVFYKNQDLLELKDENMRKLLKNNFSIIFQNPSVYLNPLKKIGDQVSECLPDITQKEKKKRLIELFEEVHLPIPSTIMNYYPHQLSGGMKQRVFIAMALANNPNLLIADEPTTALDVTTQKEILELIKRIREKYGTSTIFITHDLGIAAEICDRIYVMYMGKIVENANVFQLFKDPKHPYTKLLIASTFDIEKDKADIESYTLEGKLPNPFNHPIGCKFHTRCPYVMEKCKKDEPPFVTLNSNHKCACWLYE